MIILLTFLFSVRGACAENLIVNGDFEILDTDGIPENWYTDAYTQETGFTVFSTEDDPSGHGKIAAISNLGRNDARFAQVVPVEPDTLYCLSGYILAEDIRGGHGANLSIEGVYAFSEKVYDTDGKWKYIEYYGETGPEQEYLTVFARLGGYSGESTGKACFDQISLVSVDNVPGDAIADLWFKDTSGYDEEGDEADDVSGPAWPWLTAVGLFYAFALLWTIRAVSAHRFRESLSEDRKMLLGTEWFILLLSFALRMIVSSLVPGYMVDVNCFLSWGHTMSVHGPAGFYTATNFCDYPPLYTYVLGLNSVLSDSLNTGAGATRIVFRFLPNLCDVIACGILFRLLVRSGSHDSKASLAFLAFLALNPATILNSAAWGQMDSVLCLLLMIVALLAEKGKWILALPVYVVAVLVKPQALMLGPLGLVYMILALVRKRSTRRPVMIGTLISTAVLFLGVVPFSSGQEWNWIIQLYQRTLASYPYATVNTANFYYLLGGNWAKVGQSSHVLAPVLLCISCLGFGAFWHFRAGNNKPLRQIETILSVLFAGWFMYCAVTAASWAMTGAAAMAFAFVIILSSAVRCGRQGMLPWLGGLLFILLYVFGVKMHERYLFPALFLLACAYVFLRDRRILYVLCLFSMTMFLNEGIVLDNSIRLGSELGHLNRDTVWLADIISVLNVLGSVYAVYLNYQLLEQHDAGKIWSIGPVFPFRTVTDSRSLLKWNLNRKLHWCRKDTFIMLSITLVYSVISLLTLGSTKAPQTAWTSSSEDESVVLDLGEYKEDFSILYFARVSREDFSVSVSPDLEFWTEETWAQMDQGQCWKWKYVTESYDYGGQRSYYNSDRSNIVSFSGRYIRITAHQVRLTLNEIMFRDPEGRILPASVLSRSGGRQESELYSDPSALLDEQDTMEKLPSLFGTAESAEEPAEPSWWNSTYFDEIYHARTAFEFLEGTTPYETSHPPLGKVLMSASVALFGMTPFGWRFAGAVAGIIMLPGMYLLAKQLTKKTRTATLACLFMSLDCLHLTQTQIATIDSFPVLFIIFAYLFMLRFIQTDLRTENMTGILLSLFASGLFMGLSIASKWIGIYAGAGLAVLFFWHCFRMLRIDRKEMSCRPVSVRSDERTKEDRNIPLADNTGITLRIIKICLWCILFFILIPLLIYLLSYIPYMSAFSGRIHSLTDYISEVWKAQVGMFNYHSTKNLGMDHPFYSPWWQWPVIGKPMYYVSEQYIDRGGSMHYSIFCFGNPVIWFGGLAALLACFIRWLSMHRYRLGSQDGLWHFHAECIDCRYILILIGFLAQYLPWVLVPRGTYIYHYFASLPFLMLALSLVTDGIVISSKRYSGIVQTLVVILAVAAFILFFPYASGLSCPAAWMNPGKSFLHIWY